MSDEVTLGGNSAGALRAFIERVERLEEDKAEISDDIKAVYTEVKGAGLDAKAMRRIVALRKMDASKRQQQAELIALYAEAIGLDGAFA
jgi:uncharacterized protein (UPF0335 family)